MREILDRLDRLELSHKEVWNYQDLVRYTGFALPTLYLFIILSRYAILFSFQVSGCVGCCNEEQNPNAAKNYEPWCVICVVHINALTIRASKEASITMTTQSILGWWLSHKVDCYLICFIKPFKGYHLVEFLISGYFPLGSFVSTAGSSYGLVRNNKSHL